MKRLAFIAGMLLFVAAVTSGSAQAYYLDAPHNESNGFTCRTCHSNSAWWNYTSTNIDETVRNAVCLSCHDAASTDSKKGPSKPMHSDLALNGTQNWTTQCTDCHDPHYQPQLDWATVDSARLWLATGTVGTVTPVAAPTGGPAGSTVIAYTGITGKSIGGIDWSLYSNWTNKGGLIDSARATDGTRGLILVPDTSSPNDSFEIIAADATTITVKGQMSATSGATFGIIYGDNIRSTIKKAGAQGTKTVKFFVPNVIANDYGGFVDERAVTTPVGLCQVCHPPYVAGVSSNNNHWNTDNSGDQHNSTARCTQCHDPLNSFAGGADHTAKIVAYSGTVTPSGGGTAVAVNCDDCHSDVSAAPDSAHLNRGAVNLYAGDTSPYSDGTGCGACHNSTTSSLNGNIAITRLGLTDANFGTGSYPVTCAACHPNKPQAVADGTHGGHSSSAFGWDSNCATCHPDNGGGVVKDVHNNNCLNCHDNSSGGTGTTILGSSTNGSDGDARTSANGGPVTSGSNHTETCTSCHGIGTTNSIADAHHLASTNNYAQNGNCTQCHDSSTNLATASNGIGHSADHSALIADYTNCTNCHSANAGTSQGAAIDSANNKVHDGCVACHNTDSSLKTTGQVNGSIVSAMPNPTSASNDGGGDCSACHGEYFTSHQNIDHASSRVTSSTNCANCHNSAPSGAARAAITAPFTGSGEVHFTSGCATCHQADGSLVSATSLAPGIATGGGDCETCHLAGTNTWTSIHSSASGVDHTGKVQLAANCDGCHTTTTPGASSAARDAVTAPYTGTGEVHVTNDCATCHDTTTGLTRTSGLSKAVQVAQGDCETCHVNGTTVTWTTIHSSASGVSHSGRVDAETPCSNCHAATQPAGSNARTAATAPFTGSTSEVHGGSGCATCHDTTDGSTLTTGYTKADTITAGGCTGCHTATSTWESIHDGASGVDHSGKVYNNTLCGSCHGNGVNANAPDAITPPYVGSGEAHVTNGCSSCHNTTTGAELTVSAPGGSAAISSGDCQACHDQYFGAHNHDHSATVIATSSCANCHAATQPTGSQALTAATAPFVGAGEVHSAASCATCHNTTSDGSLRSGTKGDATVSDGGDGQWECAECHANQWDAIHSSVATSVHDISATAGCATCHGNSVAGSNARDAVTAPYTGTGEVHNDGAGTTCGTCHNVTTGARITGTKGDATVSDGGDGTWVCAECHTSTWYALHMNAASDGAASGVSHAGRVDIYSDGTYGSCDNCHTGTNGGASGLMPVSSTDNKVHDACTVCHATDGSLNTGTTTYGGQTLAAGTCATCHTATYFDNHDHGKNTPVYTTGHDVAFVAATDISQTGGASNSCYNCHDDAGLGKAASALSTWASIKTEHATVGGTTQTSICATCHDLANNGNQSGDANTPLLSTVQSVIATGTGNTCISCHVPKSYANSPSTSQHGGHSASDFAWTTTTQASCGATSCHNYSTNTDVVKDIHGGSCLTCHTSSGGGLATVRYYNGNTGVDSTNGIDADPSLAISSGTDKTTTCLGCHKIGSANVDAASIGGIHHNVLSAQNGQCTTCHTAVDHTSMIKDSTSSCVGCHTGTAASAGSNPPVDPNDAKVHDACTTCHTLAAAPAYNGALVSPTGNKGVGAMPDGGTIGGTDGGGNCTVCHTAAKQTIHHGTSKAQAGLCGTCHNTGNQGATAKKQLACLECHVDQTATGLAVVSLRLSKITYKPNSLVNTNATVGSTTTDGSGYLASHRITGASTINVYDFRACFDCHSGNNSSFPSAPVVAPFHGFPGDLSSGSIKGGTNRTNIDGTSLSSNQENTSDLLPRAEMWYHPGHQKWHRFSAWAPNRSSKGANKELYNKKPLNPSGNNTDNNCSAKSMMKDGAKKGCDFSGGEDLNSTAGKNGDLGNLTPFDNKHIQTHATLNGYDLNFNVPYTNFGTKPADTSSVPYFAAITAPETVTIQSAGYDGSTLTVTATLANGGNCADIGLIYPSGSSQVATFSGTGTCTATYNTGTMSLGAKVDAVYNAGSSVDDIGYPVNNNSAPTPASAVNDSLTAAANGTTNLSVMANDSGSGISITGVTQPSFGSVAIAGGGASVDYTGDGSTGSTSFTYTITASDSSTSTATVSLTVN